MRIALFGDSQAGGLGPHLDDLVFADTFDGYTTARVVDAAQWSAAEAADPDVVLVVSGGNDTAGRNYQHTLEAAVDAFSDIAQRIVWVGPSQSDNREVTARHDAVREQQALILPRLGIEFLDPRVWQVGIAGEHTPDGTHFTRRAYAAQAQAILAELNRFRWGPWLALAAGAAAIGIGYAAAQR